MFLKSKSVKRFSGTTPWLKLQLANTFVLPPITWLILSLQWSILWWCFPVSDIGKLVTINETVHWVKYRRDLEEKQAPLHKLKLTQGQMFTFQHGSNPKHTGKTSGFRTCLWMTVAQPRPGDWNGKCVAKPEACSSQTVHIQFGRAWEDLMERVEDIVQNKVCRTGKIQSKFQKNKGQWCLYKITNIHCECVCKLHVSVCFHFSKNLSLLHHLGYME